MNGKDFEKYISETNCCETDIKGYWTDGDYMGHIGNGKYQKFPTPDEYAEYIREKDKEEEKEMKENSLENLLFTNDCTFLAESTEEYQEEMLNEGAIKDKIDSLLDRLNGLTKIGLKREDLANPTKVKASLNKIGPLDKQNKRVIVKILIDFVVYMASVFGASTFAGNMVGNILDADFKNSYGRDNTDDINSARKNMVGLIGCVSVMIASLVTMGMHKNDYEKLLSIFDKSIKKVDKSIEKEKKGNNSKEVIKALEDNRKKLVDNKSVIYDAYKKELARLNNVNKL